MHVGSQNGPVMAWSCLDWIYFPDGLPSMLRSFRDTARAVLDSAGTRVSTWRSREFEAQALVELLRLSRLTVLYGAEGAGKTTLLKTNVLPLLRARAPDNRSPQDEKPRVVVPFPDRRVGERSSGVEVAVIFDRWDSEPLPALMARILHTLRSEEHANGGAAAVSDRRPHGMERSSRSARFHHPRWFRAIPARAVRSCRHRGI